MSAEEVHRAGPFAYREARPDGAESGPPLLCVHGFPESSWMWRHVLEAAAAAGRRAVAPDRPGFGHSEPDPPATWERQSEAIERFVGGLDLPPVVLVVHDWGGLIGLRWACEHPQRIAGLVISSSGFFSDGKWHGMAEGFRTSGTGEQMLEAMDRENFGALMHSQSDGFDERAIDEYWVAMGTPAGGAAVLEMYRSGDFEQIAPHQGKLAELGVPTLILWGGSDAFAPVAGAHRFASEIPHAELRIIEDAGHFLYADAPDEAAEAIVGFL